MFHGTLGYMSANVLAPATSAHQASAPARKTVALRILLPMPTLEFVRDCANYFHLTTSSYIGVLLARFHGLADPSYVRVGKIDLTTIEIQRPLSVGDPHEYADAFVRVPNDHAAAYREFAKKAGLSARRYLGEVVTTIHQSEAEAAEEHSVLLFGLGLEEVSDGVYRARARTA